MTSSAAAHQPPNTHLRTGSDYAANQAPHEALHRIDLKGSFTTFPMGLALRIIRGSLKIWLL